MTLFDLENGEVIISVQARNIAAFKAIWSRDRDRYKILAQKELTYVYYMADYRSPYNNIAPEEREEMIIRSIFRDERDPRLERVKNWEPDEIVANAIKVYKELNDTPTMKLLIQTKNALLDSDRLVAISRSRLNSIMELLEKTELNDEEFDVAKLGAQAYQTFKTILQIAESIPEAHKTLNAVEDMIKKEIAGNSKIRGGGALNKREI